MSDGELMIASAVVIPDPESAAESVAEQPSSSSLSLKRKQSPSPETEASKRAKLSPNDSEHRSFQRNGSKRNSAEAAEVKEEGQGSNGAEAEFASNARVGRRQTGREEERKRGQRMFGALLGTLAGAGSRGSTLKLQKQRASIEKRAQEKLQQMDAEGQRRKEEDVVRIRRKRKREQWSVDEQVLNTKHESMLHAARFLRTKTEPQLYYKPWELLPKEEDIINDQLDDIEDQVDKELEQFEHKRKRALEELDCAEGIDVKQIQTKENNDDADQDKKINGKSHDTIDHSSPAITASEPTKTGDHNAAKEQPETRKDHHHDDEMLDEHHGETMVEDAEDTVIY